MKKLLIAFGAIAGLVVVALVLCVVFINQIARRAIEEGGTYALGVTTMLGSADVGITSGTFSMSGLDVANPPGFTAREFLSLGQGNVAVTLSSLNQSVVTLPTLSLDNLNVWLEKKNDQTNYKVILANLAKLKSSSASKAKPATGNGGGAPTPHADGKRFIINELVLKNIHISADLLGGPKALDKLTKLDIPIDQIKLQNVGQTGTGVGGTGVTMAELSSIVVQAVLAAAADKGGGIIPAELLGELKGGISGLGDLDKLGMNVLAGNLGDIQKQGQKAVEDLTKKAGDAAGDAVKDLTKGLPTLGGEKKKSK